MRIWPKLRSTNIAGLTVVALGLACAPCFAQLQWNTWVFGMGAGIRFDSTGPKALLEPFAIRSTEGCASISDPVTGKLLFYTDGVNAWNREHLGIRNAQDLGGHESSTQSAAIVPVPGSKSLYYIFSIGPSGLGYDPSLYYSIIDIETDNGRGRALARRIKLVDGVTERVVVARGNDMCTYWVIAASHEDDWFSVIRISHSGLSAPNVIHTGGISWVAGYLRLSPGGRILALASLGVQESSPSVQLYAFDPVDGSIRFLANAHLPNAYGVEFSPDERFLYVSHMWPGGPGGQRTLSQIPVASILSGEWQQQMTILDTGRNHHQALQRGPDNRIYVAGVEGPYLGVIDSPNVVGIGCGFRERGVFLGSQVTAARGLPNIITNDRPADACPPLVAVGPEFGLHGVYSNESQSESRIRFWISQPGTVRIDIHDALGRRRAVALDRYMINIGDQEISLENSTLESGVYVARLEYDGQAVSQPFVIVR